MLPSVPSPPVTPRSREDRRGHGGRGQGRVITVEDSQTFDITIDTVEGMQFDKGYVSAYFVTDNDRMEP